MARTQDQVLGEFFTILPSGWALPTDAASVTASFFGPDAAEWSLVESTAESLQEEIDPRTAEYLLPDWERMLGPDPYGRDSASLNLTTAQQAQLAWVRYTAGAGNMNPADYIALAASMGVTITIREYWQTQCGQAECGQQLCNSILISGIWQAQWFKWLVTLPTTLITTPQCGSAVCDEPLGIADPIAQICATAIIGEAPSHTLPVFTYD
jgi:uncharacterized protein YmfQ (DUF2313 family)